MSNKVESPAEFNETAKFLAGIIEPKIAEWSALLAQKNAAEDADSPETLESLLSGSDDAAAKKAFDTLVKARAALEKIQADAYAYARENLVKSLSDDEKKEIDEKIKSAREAVNSGITLGEQNHENFAEFFTLPKGSRRSSSSGSSTGAGSGVSRPRVASVSLDGEALTPPTFTTLNQTLSKQHKKSNIETSDLHKSALEAAEVSDFSSLAGQTVNFTVTYDATVHNVTMTFAAPKE